MIKRITRRETLGGLLAGSLSMAAGRARAVDRPILVIVSGIVPSTSAERLAEVLGAFASRGIALAAAVEPVDPSGNVLRAESQLGAYLRRMVEEPEWQIEIAAQATGIAAMAPYFQLRRASEAQTALCRALGALDSRQAPGWRSATLLAGEPAEGASPVASVRGAGFRNVLFLPRRDTPRGYWAAADGVVQIHGGIAVRPRQTAGEMARAFAAELDAGDPAIVFLPLDGMDTLADPDVGALADSLAELVAGAIESGRSYSLRPRDLRTHMDRPDACIALRVDGPVAGETHLAATNALLTALREAGIPASVAIASEGELAAIQSLLAGDRNAFGVTPVIGAGDETARAIALEMATLSSRVGSPVTCATSGSTDPQVLSALGEAGVRAVTLACETPQAFIGLDGSGVLHLPAPHCLQVAGAMSAAGAVAGAAEAGRDAVIGIEPAAIATPEGRRALVAALSAAGRIPAIGFADLEGYRRTVMPEDRAFDLLMAARAGSLTAPAEPGVTPAERAALIGNAELAWTYIERLTDARTGLVPASAWLNGTLVEWRYTTMWDLGSALLGMIAANSLGLIDDDQFTERVSLAIRHIPEVTISGLRLPAAIAPTNFGAPEAARYNATDTGRLLVALKVLDRYTGGAFEAGRIVGRWNLDGTIINGRIHNIERGQLRDVHDNSYGFYMVRGFALWGLDVAPAFTGPPATEGTDAQMELVNEVARRGSVGTEPALLEAVELGFSPDARLIADMLYTASVETYVRTGRLVCVSEGPMNEAPWFTYQGYRFGAPEDQAWTIETVEGSPEHRTEEFRRAFAMISTKAAFLWAAVRPDPYSRMLLSYVRANTPIPGFGFASGVYHATGRPTDGYSDVNTNAIILEAIAYRLAGYPLDRVGPGR